MNDALSLIFSALVVAYFLSLAGLQARLRALHAMKAFAVPPPRILGASIPTNFQAIVFVFSRPLTSDLVVGICQAAARLALVGIIVLIGLFVYSVIQNQ